MISTAMDKKLGDRAVENQRYNATTNRCESSHRTTQRSLPKSKNFTRTFLGRAHSAMHTMSLGPIKSIFVANKALGAPNNTGSLAFMALKRKHTRYRYFQARRKSNHYKVSRMQARLRAIRNRATTEDFGHQTGCQNPLVQIDHSYQNHN